MGYGTSLLNMTLATGVAATLLLGASDSWAQVNTVTEPAAPSSSPEEPTASGVTETSEAPPVDLQTDDAANDEPVEEVHPTRRSRTLRLRELDARIAVLREERSQYGIGGPITMISLGGATLLIAAAVAVVASSCDQVLGCSGEPGYGPYVAMGIGAGVGLWGGVLLSERLGPRRELGAQILELQRERDHLKYEARLAPSLTPTTAGLRLNVTF
jgi:hypothetical protein